MDIVGLLSIPDWLLYTTLALLAAYLYGTFNHNYFKKRNIPYIKPYPMVGNFGGVFFRTQSLADMTNNLYKSVKGTRCVGLFEFKNPLLMIRDPGLIKVIGVKEFDHFMNHRNTVSESVEPLFAKNLFALRDKRWRDMRATLSPAFTSSKMKAMFLLISECGQQLADHLDRKIKEEASVSKEMLSLEVKDFFTRFTNDVIATTAFGIKCDSLKEPENEFYMMGRKVTDLTGVRSLIFLMYSVFPKLMMALNIRISNPKTNDFFRSLIHDTIATRESEGIVRPDMIHLLMQARRGELKAEAGDEETSSGFRKEEKTKLDDDDITAQAIIFFIAGFETSSNLLCFSTYLLAVHPDIQQHLQAEIDSFTERNGNKFTYEAIQKMRYLDMVLSETLRLYPPVPAVDRLCVKAFTIPETENEPAITLAKGDLLWLPIYGLHKDPQYFPEPEKFDPERFSEENKPNIQPFTYIPFGVGPRVCIAQRFALLEAKVALVHLLSRFNLHVVDKTPVPMKLAKTGFNLMAEGGFWTGFTPRVQK